MRIEIFSTKNRIQLVKNLKLDKDWTVQYVNDPKHRAAAVTNWLNRKQMERLKWPSCSPGMNPIEYLWDEVERRTKKCQANIEKELKEILIRSLEWY